jgi:hypothetical protein
VIAGVVEAGLWVSVSARLDCCGSMFGYEPACQSRAFS